jgi:predicted lipoprotein with Yx(FWY)xxD motif
MKRLIPLIVLAAVVALVVAVSSGGGKHPSANAQGGGPYGGAGNAPTPSPAANSAIDVRTTPLGKTLVDAKGRTLYLFEADKTNVSNCSGACLSIWPPLTAGAKPQAKGGALHGKIGTVSSNGAKRQVTYNGHPLYYYVADQKAGDTKGQGLNQFGAAWYVLAPSGDKINHG